MGVHFCVCERERERMEAVQNIVQSLLPTVMVLICSLFGSFWGQLGYLGWLIFIQCPITRFTGRSILSS